MPPLRKALSEYGKPSVYVIVPVYNGARTIANVIHRISSFQTLEGIVIVDDGSSDCSRQILSTIKSKRNLAILAHDVNRGYGGAQKTLIGKALELGADYVVLLHQDGQYPPEMIPLLVEIAIRNPSLDIILAPRTRMLEGHMPLIKYVGNRVLTTLQNAILWAKFSEYHTGMRLYTRRALQTLNISAYTDDYYFDTQIIAEGVAKGFSFGEIQVPTYYGPEVTQVSRILSYGVRCVLETTKCRFIYRYRATHCGIQRYTLNPRGI
jgi:glycosyltransferase involved in cell wall biosynthesis